MGEAERGESAPRITVSFWCANGHETRPSFIDDPNTTVPALWDCPRCGLPAGPDPNNPPAPPRNEPYKTHLAYVKERRTDEDGAKLLEEALSNLRARRSVRGKATAKVLAQKSAQQKDSATAQKATAKKPATKKPAAKKAPAKAPAASKAAAKTAPAKSKPSAKKAPAKAGAKK
jgi:hypothetical protein